MHSKHYRFRLHFILILFFLCSSSSILASNADITDRLQTILDKAVLHSSTPGAVLLVNSPSLGTITVAAGYSDLSTHLPMQTTNNFRLASITKTFVSVLTLQLIAENKIKLDDKIAPLLPSFIDPKRIPNGTSVTIRQLLQMRSGIPNYSEYDAYTKLVNDKPQHIWRAEEAIKIIYDLNPSFSPGVSYEYSNTNYLLLQLIIEKLTGTSLAMQLQKHLFTPLHMDHTYFEIQQKGNGGYYGLMTHGYEFESKKVVDVTAWNDGFGMGDSGVISTAQDLLLFIQALLQKNSLIPNELLSQMLTPMGGEQYGFGIYREELNERWPWTHNGSSSGFSTQYYYFPDLQLTLIVLTNFFDNDIIDEVAKKTLEVVAPNH